MSEYKLITLVNGFELIGKLVSDELIYYILEEPLGIQPQQTGPDTYGLMLTPMSAADQQGQHIIYKHAICSESIKIPTEIENAYIKRTSKIQIVSRM